jgi:hypothetical protein
MHPVELDEFPTAKDCKVRLAESEAEKASELARTAATVEAEKRELLKKLQEPSGVSDAERLERAKAIIKRAVAAGKSEVLVGRFPNTLFTDKGRAIGQVEPGWQSTLTGLPKELFEFWQSYLKPRGYRLRFEIIDYPGGIPGDIGVTLSWS